MTYQVAYLKPYARPAEEQAYQSLKNAARAVDVELTEIDVSDLKENSLFDFVISTTSATAKTTSHPTFLAVHAPRPHYFQSRAEFERLCTFDGYLTISPNLQSMLSHLSSGLGKYVTEPGYYYSSPPRNGEAADLVAGAAADRLALCYFGTNWDGRAQRLFKRLSERDYVRFYGPAEAWRSYSAAAYKGEVPFDGVSAQAEYAKYGIGLVCLAEGHLLDDVTSDTIFEISSVGAVAICPDTPWTRDAFGESVFYYDGFAPPNDVVAEIDDIMHRIRQNPEQAGLMAVEARQVFEERYSAERMIAGAVAYYERWRSVAAQRIAGLGEPSIDIVIRTGGRGREYLQRAIASIAKQTVGRLRLIIVKYQPVDLTWLNEIDHGRIRDVEIIDCFGGNRGEALSRGIESIRSTYFAVLDDDDYLLASHFQHLLEAMADVEAHYRVGYSDILRLEEGGGDARNAVSLLKAGPGTADIYSLLGRFSSHCFLATSNVLSKIPTQHWRADTAEDGMLLFSILRHATPVHSPNATCIYSQGRSDASAYLEHPRRKEDEFSLTLEVAPFREAIERKFNANPPAAYDMLQSAIARVAENRRMAVSRTSTGAGAVGQCIELEGTSVQLDQTLASSVLDREVVLLEVPLDLDRVSGNAEIRDFAAGGALHFKPQSAWELSVEIGIEDYVIPGCAIGAVGLLKGADRPISLCLLDGGSQIVSHVPIPNSSKSLFAAVFGPQDVTPNRVALQAGAEPAMRPVSLLSLHTAYDAAELRDALHLASDVDQADEAAEHPAQGQAAGLADDAVDGGADGVGDRQLGGHEAQHRRDRRRQAQAVGPHKAPDALQRACVVGDEGFGPLLAPMSGGGETHASCRWGAGRASPPRVCRA